ncbi:MAG: 50S ribosomal protein L23 [Psychroflexus sp.]|jgi:large subunit ribosomal protein L23|nr:50S ribosomal protein L23 [Psychroflexus sp.]MDR9447662.1 50S ribosomal protein L23 [Psychroflexus sp.]
MEYFIQPIITEKATDDSELNNRYWFKVDKKADKINIKKTIESTYDVKVASVRTMNIKPKSKSRFTKTGVIQGTTKAYKKAIVDLKEGDTIDIYSNL